MQNIRRQQQPNGGWIILAYTHILFCQGILWELIFDINFKGKLFWNNHFVLVVTTISFKCFYTCPLNSFKLQTISFELFTPQTGQQLSELKWKRLKSLESIVSVYNYSYLLLFSHYFWHRGGNCNFISGIIKNEGW